MEAICTPCIMAVSISGEKSHQTNIFCSPFSIRPNIAKSFGWYQVMEVMALRDGGDGSLRERDGFFGYFRLKLVNEEISISPCVSSSKLIWIESPGWVTGSWFDICDEPIKIFVILPTVK